MVLPITGMFSDMSCKLRYDQVKNQYYIGGSRSVNSTGPLQDLAYNNIPIVNRSYILAFNGTTGTELWRREFYSNPVNGLLAPTVITSIELDANSDVYVSGELFKQYNDNVKILDPNNPGNTTYFMSPAVNTNMPILVKFNSNGAVQWAKTPTSFATGYTSNSWFEPKGIAINGNEVAMGSSESYFEWDGFTQNHPQFYRPEPTLLRFDKQTGATLGMHSIKGDPNHVEQMRAVAADKDGNYITGGYFRTNLFMNNTLGITPMITNGYNDFFVARLKISCAVPAPSFTSSNAGAVYSFNYAGTGTYTSINWNFGDGTAAVSGTATPSHTYTTSGTYNVCVTVVNECGADTLCKSLTVTAPNTGLAEAPGFEQVTVFPNPAQSQLQVNKAQAGTTLRLLDVSGRQVLTQRITRDTETIDISALAPGIYFLQLKNNAGQEASMKLVKQ
jgi:PKD repeat protein